MHLAKYSRLRADCQPALSADNLEKCFWLLRQGFNISAETQKDVNVLEGSWNRVKRFYGEGQLVYAEFSKELTRVPCWPKVFGT